MKKIFFIFILGFIAFLSTGAGYVGTLPDVEADFAYMRKEKTKKTSSPYSVEELDKRNEKNLKPIPKNDDSYIDIVIKRDKNSAYTNDINYILTILEKLRRCLNTNQDIQIFNAIVSNLIDNIEYLHNEYKDKDESNYASFNKLLILSKEARETAMFRTMGLSVQKYKPYTSSDNIYTKENLDKKLESLLNNVNETIFILNNSE